jgi:hypothetical protein
MRILAILLLLFTFLNCKSSDKKVKLNQDQITSNDTIVTTSKYDSLTITTNDILPFSNKVSKIVAFGIKKEGEPFTLNFDVTTQTKAFIKIITENPTANIRVNQIIYPDQKSDGPFGKDVEFPLYQGGMYKIVIDESLMQGNPFNGNFKIEIELK